MIYLKNNSETQELYIPKNGDYQGKRTYKEGFEEGIEYQKSKLSSIEIKENGLYQNEDGYNEVLVDVLSADNADIRTLYAFDNGEFTPNYNHILFDGTAYMTRTYGFGSNGSFTLIFKIPSGVDNSTILSDRNGLINIKHEDSNINIKVGDKTGSIAIERDKWHTLEIVGFDTYLLDNNPIPTQGETNLGTDDVIMGIILGSKFENYTYTDRFQGCINLVIFNEEEGGYIYYLVPNQNNVFTQVGTNGRTWNKLDISSVEGVFTFVEESAENVLWNKALVRYIPKLTSPSFNIEGYDFTNNFTTPEGYEGMRGVQINNLKQASRIMEDGNGINMNTITDRNTFEITENGFYTPNQEIIPTVWFMDKYITAGWDIADIQQERIEVRFLVTPEMIKDRSCWLFGKSDEVYISDDPQIFGLEITSGDDYRVIAKYYQNGLKQEIDISYQTWIDFITYPHPDNAEIRIIECLGQYYEVENSALSTDGNRVTKWAIGGLTNNRYNYKNIKSNTEYFGMLSSVKVSTDNYYKETTISIQNDSIGIGIGFEEEGITLSKNLSYYEYYRNSGFGSVIVNVPQEGGGEGGSCNLFDEMIGYNGTYQPNLKYLNLDGDDCFYSHNFYNPYRKIEIVFRPYGEGTIIGFYNWNPEDYWGLRMINNRQIYVRWGSRYGTFGVEPNEWNKVILEPENNNININGFGFTLEQDDNQDYPYNEITIGGEYQGVYTTANYDFQYAVIYDDIMNVDSDYTVYTAEGENSILNADYFGSGTATFYTEPKDGFRNITVLVKPNLEEKWENWDNPDERERYFHPSEGYDGMRQVYVSIDAALNAENQRGKAQGENEIKSAMTTINITENGTYRVSTFNVMDIDNDDVFIMNNLGYGVGIDQYFEIKFKINRNGSTIEGGLLSQYYNDMNLGGEEKYQGIILDSDSQISFRWGNKYGSASIDPNGWNIIRFSPGNPDTSKRVWVNGESIEVYEDDADNNISGYSFIGGYNETTGEIKTGAFDLAYVNWFMEYQYGWEEGHIPIQHLPEANNTISDCDYIGAGMAWLERDGEVGWNEVIVDVPQEGGGDITSSIVEDTYSVLALRTENVNNNDIIKDRTKLVGSGDEYTENGFISYTQNKNGIVISGSNEIGSKYVTKIRKDALNWDTIEYFYSYTIVNFGVDMTRDTGSNVMEIHIKYNGGVGLGISNDIYFRTGCFATSNRLNKIVFYEPYYISVEENAFEGVSSSGEVIVVGEDNTENRAKYDTLMNQLGDGWTLMFVNEYNE